MEGERFTYQFDASSEEDVESATHQRYTVDKGVNSAGAVNFVVEPHEEDFIDTAACYLKTSFRIVREDGEKLEEAGDVFLAPNYGANLWSQVGISLNNVPLPPGNDYQYTALLIDLLGASPAVRDGVLAPLSGFSSPAFASSKVSSVLQQNPIMFDDLKKVGSTSKEVTVFHRIHSDFLQSCSQLLPNRMQLGISLTRGKDSVILSKDSSDLENYRVEILAVSLFVKRVKPSVNKLQRLSKQLAQGGKLHYQRLHMIPYQCAEGNHSWTWHNCFNNVIPERVFVALVSQEAYFGSYSRISSYLESGGVKRVRFCRDGREVMAEPYTSQWKYPAPGVVDTENSEAKGPFAGLLRATGVFSSQRHFVGIEYDSYLNGSTVWGVQLHQSNSPTGSLDIHIEFEETVKEPMMVLVMGEYQKTLHFDKNRNVIQI